MVEQNSPDQSRKLDYSDDEMEHIPGVKNINDNSDSADLGNAIGKLDVDDDEEEKRDLDDYEDDMIEVLDDEEDGDV